MCDKTNHNLIEIYRDGWEDEPNAVVRWCEDCGAIVVDGEMDGRTSPGAVRKMLFPKEFKGGHHALYRTS